MTANLPLPSPLAHRSRESRSPRLSQPAPHEYCFKIGMYVLYAGPPVGSMENM